MPVEFMDALQASPVMTVLGWAVTFLVHSTLLIGAVWVATRFGLARSPHLRETLWKTALVGGLISASVQTVSGPALFVRALPVEVAAASATSPEDRQILVQFQGGDNLWVASIPQEERVGRHTLMPAVPEDLQANILGGGGLAEGIPAAFDNGSRDLAGTDLFIASGSTFEPGASSILAWMGRNAPYLLLALWVLGAALALARLMRSHLRLHRGLRGRIEVRDEQVLSLLNRLREAGEVRRSVRLTVHPRLSGPIAFGRGEICLPQRVLTDLDRNHQESVLAHELGHVVRRDPAWLTAGGVLQALFFFQPLIRTARRRLQEEAEFLCDDWAVSHTGRGLILARCLARVADWVAVRPHATPVSGMAANDSPLVRRVERLLDESRRPSRGLPPAARVAVLLMAVGTAALFAPGLSARVRPSAPAPAPAPGIVLTGDAPAPLEVSGFGLEPFTVTVPLIEVAPRVAWVSGDEGAWTSTWVSDDGKVSVGGNGPHDLLHFVSARPMIGVTIGEVGEALRVHLGLDEDEGALITRVIEGGAAEEAGIEPYDIVLTCDGEPVDQGALVDAVRSHEDGETVKLTVLRRGERKTFEVEVRESDRGVNAYFAPEVAFPGQERGFVVPDVRFPRELRGLLAPEAPAPPSRKEALLRLQELEGELQRLMEEMERSHESIDHDQGELLRRRVESLTAARERATGQYQSQLRTELQRRRADESHAHAVRERVEASRLHDRYADVLKEIEVAGTARLRSEFEEAGVRLEGRDRERFHEALAAAVEETTDELILSFKDDEIRIENDPRELRDRLRSRIAIQCERLGVKLDGDAWQKVDGAVDATVVYLRYLELR